MTTYSIWLASVQFRPGLPEKACLHSPSPRQLPLITAGQREITRLARGHAMAFMGLGKKKHMVALKCKSQRAREIAGSCYSTKEASLPCTARLRPSPLGLKTSPKACSTGKARTGACIHAHSIRTAGNVGVVDEAHLPPCGEAPVETGARSQCLMLVQQSPSTNISRSGTSWEVAELALPLLCVE